MRKSRQAISSETRNKHSFQVLLAQLVNLRNKFLYDGYRISFALLSKSYVNSYYEYKFRHSQSLKELEQKLRTRLAECDVTVVRRARQGVIIVVTLAVVYWYLAIHVKYSSPAVHNYVESIGAAVVYATEFGYFWRTYRSINEERATLIIFHTIVLLETRSSDWHTSTFRLKIAQLVERIAQCVERIPLKSRKIAASVQRDAIKIGKSKAQGLRQLEAGIIMPGELTRTKLIELLTKDMCIIADYRWYELPEGPEGEKVHSRLLLAIQITTSVLIIGLAALAAKMGPAYTLVVAAILGIGATLLKRLGLSVEYLSDIVKQEED